MLTGSSAPPAHLAWNQVPPLVQAQARQVALPVREAAIFFATPLYHLLGRERFATLDIARLMGVVAALYALDDMVDEGVASATAEQEARGWIAATLDYLRSFGEAQDVAIIQGLVEATIRCGMAAVACWRSGDRAQADDLIMKNTAIEPVTAIYWLLANPGQSLARLLARTTGVAQLWSAGARFIRLTDDAADYREDVEQNVPNYWILYPRAHRSTAIAATQATVVLQLGRAMQQPDPQVAQFARCIDITLQAARLSAHYSNTEFAALRRPPEA
jgi:hypothetical protein